MSFLCRACILITGCNNVSASLRTCGGPAGARSMLSVQVGPCRPAAHVQACLTCGDTSDLSCSFLPQRPRFCLLLSQWRVRRGRQGIRGSGETLMRSWGSAKACQGMRVWGHWTLWDAKTNLSQGLLRDTSTPHAPRRKLSS